MRRLIALLLTAVVAGCVPAGPPAREAPPPRPALRPAPPRSAPPAPDWRDRPFSPGVWRYVREAGGSAAMFGASGSLAIRCDLRARRVLLIGPGSGAMVVRATSTTRTLPIQPSGGGTPAAVLSPSDPLLDAVAFSRGKVLVEQPGAPPLVIPAWPEIGRVVEDCRG